MRSYGWSWETISGSIPEVAAALLPRVEQVMPRVLHCWSRDAKRVGDRGFEPFLTETSTEFAMDVAQQLGQPELAVNLAGRSHRATR